MKNVTKHYVPRQRIIVKREEIDRFFQYLAGTKDHFDRITLVAVSLMYLGLLRQGKVLQVTIDKVSLNDKERLVHVDFNKRTKSRARGFSYTIPSFLYTIFKQYINELHPKSSGEHFFKNLRANKNVWKEGKYSEYGEGPAPKDSLSDVFILVHAILSGNGTCMAAKCCYES